MEQKEESLQFNIDYISPNFCKAIVTVPSKIVEKIYEEAVAAQKKSARPYGFHHDKVPLDYVKKNFESNIRSHLEEFLFKYFVLSFLYQQIREIHLNAAGDPRLTNIYVKPGEDAIFNFDISLFKQIEFQNWKYYPFRAPKRKNYKDLDRQAADFMRIERKKRKEYSEITASEILPVLSSTGVI